MTLYTFLKREQNWVFPRQETVVCIQKERRLGRFVPRSLKVWVFCCWTMTWWKSIDIWWEQSKARAQSEKSSGSIHRMHRHLEVGATEELSLNHLCLMLMDTDLSGEDVLTDSRREFSAKRYRRRLHKTALQLFLWWDRYHLSTAVVSPAVNHSFPFSFALTILRHLFCFSLQISLGWWRTMS